MTPYHLRVLRQSLVGGPRDGRAIRELPGMLAWCVCALGVAACGRDGQGDTGRPPKQEQLQVAGGQAFDDVFTVLDTIALEETDEVITISPRVSPDPRGGFFVADPNEQQVRVYSALGRLTELFGAGTTQRHPMEHPQRAVRLPGGEVLVISLEGDLTIIPGAASGSARQIHTTLRTIRDVEVLDGHEVLLAGTDSAPPSATLFVMDLAANRIVKKLLPPPAHLDKWVTTYFSTVRIAGRGGRIAAVHMLLDTVVILDRAGEEMSRVWLPLDPFVVPTGPLPDLQSEVARREWTSRFTIISDVWWRTDDHLIVQWHKLRPDHGMDWGILRMDTAGRRIWAVAPAPHLYAVIGGRFVFRDPEAEAPNRWLIAAEMP